MPVTLEKLSPETDLQVYFERPSAIAAMSQATANSFRLTGAWRQQFDWAVVEWNQNNVFEHPLFRNLPDGDLSGLTLTYEETRDNCIPIDSNIFPTVDWPYLRIWTRQNGVEDFFKVDIKSRATPVEGSYAAASAELQLGGTPTAGDFVGVSFQQEHFTHEVTASDTIEDIVQAIADSINVFSTGLAASRTGTVLRVTLRDASTGRNGNRLGLYGFVAGAKTETWAPWWTVFSGGQSPVRWRVTINFANLTATDGRTVPAAFIRKMRWTYAAELQSGAYQRSEYAVEISNWTVTGANRRYQVAGPGSRRMEDDDRSVQYLGAWQTGRGNFSGGSIRFTAESNASCSMTYSHPASHKLYLGSRLAFNSADVEVRVDGNVVLAQSLLVPGEDALARLLLGTFPAGSHTVLVKHAGPAGPPDHYLYFDFLEICMPVETLPVLPADNKVTLATDWDTDHSLAVPAERTAWMIHSLGYHGRANHYVGALWFYELVRTGHVYSSATIEFVGTPVFSATTQVTITQSGEATVLSHLNRIGDTAETIAKAFELELNKGYTSVRASSSGSVLTVYSRLMGAAGNAIGIAVSPSTGSFHGVASGSNLAGGNDGKWHTDLTSSPRLNRAVRDWSRAFYSAMHAYGIDVTAAFSLELQHGDDSVEAGIAQRYPNGDPALLNTPALQTNFSPASIAFWKEVHKEMAGLMQESGIVPYMQLGEVQWWYFPSGGGMPFYDAYTTSLFQATYGRPMGVIPSQFADPAAFPEEVAFLPTLIGAFTAQVVGHVRAAYPNCRVEVLYPTDVNNTALNSMINYPVGEWTPAKLDNLKTESFSFTFARDLNLSRLTIDHGAVRGFPRSRRSFLVGINDPLTPWMKEVRIAKAQGIESIVLFALDQYCLVGYETPLPAGMRRCAVQG